MPFVSTWVDLEIILSKSKRERYHTMYDIWNVDMWNLKYDKNEFVYDTETDS